MEKLFKQFTATVEPVTERKMSFTISTASVDRDGDTIDPKGWDLKSYEKNPVVLWAHDYSQPPVGKAINIQATQDGLKADVEFLPAGMSPFADMIHDMVKGGFLNATSVGFRGEGEKAKDRDKGYDFKKQELLEFSIVPVPSNPEALALRGVTAEQATLYAKGMRIWVKSVLGDEAPKMDQEQFDSLADAIAKAMPKHKDETPDEKKEDKTDAVKLDYAEIAKEVAKILKSETSISTDVLAIEQVDGEIDWDAVNSSKANEDGFDPKDVSELLLDSVRTTFREMAGAQARAAINQLTGRLD